MIDNKDTGIHSCPVCGGPALNKGLLTIKQDDKPVEKRQVFCITDGSHLIDLKGNERHKEEYSHEFQHYEGSHLENLYKITHPERHAEFLAMPSTSKVKKIASDPKIEINLPKEDQTLSEDE